MAKGQHLSRYQQGIVRRIYLHRALAEGKKADTLWKRAEETLRKLETEPPIPESRIETICTSRDVAAFAQFVGELQSKA